MKNNTADEIKQGFANIIGNVRIASDNRTQEEIKKMVMLNLLNQKQLKYLKNETLIL